MAQSNYKVPPILTTDTDYEIWEKEIEIWRLFTSSDKNKQVPAIFFEFNRSS